MKQPLKIFKIALLILAALLIAYALYVKFFKPAQAVAIDSKPISYVYLWNNNDFNKAERLTLEGKYDEALDTYNVLLQSDLSKEDVITKSQLSIRIATLLDSMGEKSQAITALNQIATNEKEYFITRSFAYEYMARMLFETRSPDILSTITSITGLQSVGADPYQSISKQLLQRSEAIAPLYLALTQEMKVDLLSATTPFTAENTKSYRYDLGVIDRMIADIRDEQNVGYMLPLALLRKAQVAERIEASGNYGLPKKVEDYYIDAAAAYEKYPEARSYNYVYYEYARYLANRYSKDMETFGESRKGDIQVFLNYYKKDVPEKQNLKIFLQNIEKENKNNLQKKELNQVKVVVPNFSI
jgi:tetratricopeptide (TPR) repeat protein